MISERDLLDHFEDFKRRRDDEWMAICPAHADRNPSLHVTRTPARWLLKCHAGCETEDVLAAIGLDWGDLFPARVNGRGEEVTAYSYTDEHGEPLFEVVRLWPKGFYQRRPNGEKPPPGQKPMDGVRRVLYRLPKVIDAIKAGMTIWIAAGEKDVHALERAGVVATCNPMGEGEGKWLRHYSETLRGAEVVIVVDRDEEGRAHGGRVVEALDGVAASVELVEPVVGKDAADHLAACKTIDEFVPVDREAKRDPALEPGTEPEGDAEPRLRLRFIRASEIEPESVRWLWADRIPLSSSTLLVGREGVAKSMLVYRLVADATRGRLAGEFAGQPVPAIVATFEDAVASAAVPRLRAANADMNLVEFVTLRGDHSEPLQFPDDLEEIERRVAATGARLLTIDPLVATLPEKVNTHRDQHVRRALVPIQAMAEAQTLSALPVIHFNKAPGADPLLRVGGSIGFVASARSVLALGYDPDDPEGEEGNSRILAHPKSNYARKRKSVRCTVKPTSFEHRGKRIETACLELGEECDVGAAEFLAGRDPDARPKEDEAREWLIENLTREWKRSALVKDQAKKDGQATRTVQRAFSRMEEKGEAELREEGFPAHSEWRLAVAPSPESRHGATVGWRDCTNPLPERDCGESEPQSRHTTKSYGATGEETPPEAPLPTPSGRLDEDDEIAAFERLLEEKRREGR